MSIRKDAVTETLTIQHSVHLSGRVTATTLVVASLIRELLSKNLWLLTLPSGWETECRPLARNLLICCRCYSYSWSRSDCRSQLSLSVRISEAYVDCRPDPDDDLIVEQLRQCPARPVIGLVCSLWLLAVVEDVCDQPLPGGDLRANSVNQLHAIIRQSDLHSTAPVTGVAW